MKLFFNFIIGLAALTSFTSCERERVEKRMEEMHEEPNVNNETNVNTEMKREREENLVPNKNLRENEKLQNQNQPK